ncbi:MAG: hypothetical protein K0V04_39695 [Deltaproteobacteria bacterium]|nr:hypothetical protein [Deltaproteobacteria bacterium]
MTLDFLNNRWLVLAAGLLLAACSVAARTASPESAAQSSEASPDPMPQVPLNHVYVVLDEQTFRAVRDSESRAAGTLARSRAYARPAGDEQPASPWARGVVGRHNAPASA